MPRGSSSARQVPLLLLAVAVAAAGILLTAHSGREVGLSPATPEEVAAQDAAEQAAPSAASPSPSAAPAMPNLRTQKTVVAPTLERPQGSPPLEVLDHHPAQSGGTLMVKGHVRNNASTAAGYVRVAIAILDQSGNQIDTASSTTTDLPAHAAREFTIVVSAVGAHGYRLLGASTTP